MKVGKDNKRERRKELSTYVGSPKIRLQSIYFNLMGTRVT